MPFTSRTNATFRYANCAVPDAKGFASEIFAVNKLERELATVGRTLTDTRWVVIVNKNGFVPCIIPGKDIAEFMSLTGRGIALLG
jgi:hypothetical protein